MTDADRKKSKKKKAENKCKVCGYPIAKGEEYCGECVCEEDGL